ncbi:MAG: hypothetical protein LBS48_01140 [Treponema sp.]|jgi:hypothetical protein|nr:hypothetical protein [Treponema sp.]
MKQLFIVLTIFLLAGVSCVSDPPPALPVQAEKPAAPVPVQADPPAPEPMPEPAPAPVVEPAPAPVEEEPVFNPGSISQEEFDTAKNEVQALVEDLNRIIRARNYNYWLTYLSKSYLEEINSPEYLDEMTEKLYERDRSVATNLGRDPKSVQKRILRNSRDFFTYVVVPSRANDHVDDIEYVSENQVTAYTLDNRGQRLILYNLETIDGQWKISN